ncbi:hypothetical protein [Desertivirga xinjiangensis]|uniref:hypothetical protein n=1 Tax=Desertivirga xinjiangensis TaxID=539206 RepID=UPI00210E1E4B|nr:hypothetical protein [Pedobacter xinjiangensis]
MLSEHEMMVMFKIYFSTKLHVNFMWAAEFCRNRRGLQYKCYFCSMGSSFIFKACLIFLSIQKVSIPSLAAQPLMFAFNVTEQQEKKELDEKKQEDKKTQKKDKQEPKADAKKPDIKEVPKARRQSRPKVVTKPDVKVKPVKISRPKIKKP